MKKAIILGSILALISCSQEKVKVFIDKSEKLNLPMSILIDDSIKISITSDTIIELEMQVGKHKINKNHEDKVFEVGKQGGIINLDNAEYVMYEIKYTESGRNFHPSDLYEVMPIIIDSFMVFKNFEFGGTVTHYPDSLLVKKLPEIESAKAEIGTKKFAKFGKNKFYIEKFWDYDLGEEIQKNLTVEENRGASFGTVASKYRVVRAEEFLVKTLFFQDGGYEARTITSIKSGKFDKNSVPKN